MMVARFLKLESWGTGETKVEKQIKIMPCLDMQNGRVVKGVHFVDIKDAGDPAECAQAYCEAGADELALLDITATVENRPTMLEVGEGGQAERVTVTPMSQMTENNFGGDTFIFQNDAQAAMVMRQRSRNQALAGRF